jgi:hypothetical protein
MVRCKNDHKRGARAPKRSVPMSMIRVSRLAALSVAFSVAAPWIARADAPNACKFLTNAAVAAVVGKPVTGGSVSVVDHSGASASSCSYMAGMTIVVISVDERGTAAAAMKEYSAQLDNSHLRDKEKEGAADAQKTVLEPGIGEGAFSDDMLSGSVLSITAVHGSRIFTLGIVGGGPIPHERVRGLMQSAISH